MESGVAVETFKCFPAMVFSAPQKILEAKLILDGYDDRSVFDQRV